MQIVCDIYNQQVIVKGFKEPKTIVDFIRYEDKIKYIEFDDGTTFPEKYEYSTTTFNLDLLKTLFFKSRNEFDQHLVDITLRKPDNFKMATGLLSESDDNENSTERDFGANPIVKKFIKWCAKKLQLQSTPTFEFSYDTDEAQGGHHTGRHVEGSNECWVYVKNRNMVDVLRTVAHELRHVQQSEQGKIKPGSSYPFSPIESDADVWAGGIIKIFGKQHPEIFQ
jgi:hypothetical protein